MKIKSAHLQTSAPDLDACPDSDLPEFAFVGRSNVGKSSLINLLTGKEGLARTSGQPGKTQCMNFFKINNAWYLIDLPGYGYARVSKQDRHRFNLSVSAYLTQRSSLRHVFALIDSQHEPMDSDLSFIEWLQKWNIPFSLVFTKTDRASPGRVQHHADYFLEECDALTIHPVRSFRCSSQTGSGRKDLLGFIDTLLPRPAFGAREGKQTRKKKSGISLGWMKKGK